MLDIGVRSRDEASLLPPVLTINADGRSPFVLVCDHASNRIPAIYGDLGLSSLIRLTHVAWDPGALAVALALSDLLDAPLVHSSICRLVVDCNRAEDAVDLIPIMSERTAVPGNVGIPIGERRDRVARYHAPFHRAIETLLDGRRVAGQTSILVAIHSFTPVYKGVARPWPIGLIPARNERFSRALQGTLLDEAPDLALGWNQPYAAFSGVTYTLEHHADGRGLDACMLEIRHDEILEPEGVAFWAARLGRCLTSALGGASAVAHKRLEPRWQGVADD